MYLDPRASWVVHSPQSQHFANEQLGSGLDKASSGLLGAVVTVVPFVVLKPVLFQSVFLTWARRLTWA